QRQNDQLATVSTERQMLEHALTLGRRKCLLGERGQEIGIWMSPQRQRRVGRDVIRLSRPQPVIHDFGYFSHFQSVLFYHYQGTPLPRNLASNGSANSTACLGHRFPALLWLGHGSFLGLLRAPKSASGAQLRVDRGAGSRSIRATAGCT